jgi:LysM repeat protein
MGQLEKYGLYVLCLVIFLILGVALWGDPAAAADRPQSQNARQAAVTVKPPSTQNFDLNEMGDILRGAPTEEPKPIVQPQPQGGDEPKQEPQKQPEPQPEPQPIEEQRETYTVVAKDSLSSIARKKLGSERHVKALLELNPGVTPERLKVGQKLTLPTSSELTGGGAAIGKQPEPSGSGSLRTHEVAKGDTFEGLAMRYLNDRKRVSEIKKLNPTLDPTKLREGQKILIPAK